MSKNIDITSRMTNEKPTITWGDKEYKVNNSTFALFKFQEMSGNMDKESIEKGIKISLGEEALKDFNLEELSVPNLKVLMSAIAACMQDITLEEAEARFQRSKG